MNIFQFKILLTHLNWNWCLVNMARNLCEGSNEQFIDMQDMTGNSIATKKRIRHGKWIREWVRR